MAKRHSTPTMYKGILFRSFLEAEWARYFDDDNDLGTGSSWRYEPIRYQIDTFSTYTPDFEVWVRDPHDVLPVAGCLLEVKPTLEQAELDNRMPRLSHLGARGQYRIKISFFLVAAGEPGSADIFRYDDGLLVEHWDDDDGLLIPNIARSMVE
jgi:hypothetical protein